MAEYIERETFLKQKREQYCKDCDRRKGMRNGKYKTLYEIGEAPFRACGIDDLLNDAEDFPTADVRHVVNDCYKCPYKQICHDLPIDMSCDDVLNSARWRKTDGRT